ncbi:MAG TPA: alpha/beta hydrolase [Candidatus Dormibacteraeota bacterium]|nr:alpha/beta hydrolase [Candidatus Dormibacteraeota bacterium]
MQIVVDDLLAYYDLSGKGKLILLLHGWGDNARGLSALRQSLAKKYQVLALDLPGFGSSQAPREVWDLDNYAGFIQASLNKLDLNQPYAVIGHSNGGALAVRAVSLGLLKPQKLVLLAASGIRTGGGTKRFILKVIAKTGDAATIWLPERYRQALRRSLYDAAGSDMLVMPQLQETFKKTVRQDVQADAASIAIPTLLIYAENDRAVPPGDGQKYHQLIKGSRLEMIADAGHFVHHDQPARVETLIKDFLR